MPRISKKIHQALTESKEWKKFKLKRLYPGMYFGEGWFTDKHGDKVILQVRIGRIDYHSKKSSWYLDATKNHLDSIGKWPGVNLFQQEDASFKSYNEAKNTLQRLIKTVW